MNETERDSFCSKLVDVTTTDPKNKAWFFSRLVGAVAPADDKRAAALESLQVMIEHAPADPGNAGRMVLLGLERKRRDNLRQLRRPYRRPRFAVR